MAFDSHQIRKIKHCNGWWVNGWSRERRWRETTSESLEMNALLPMLRKCGIPLPEDDIEFIANCVQTYFQVFRENYGGYPDFCMVGHSALLASLLLGNQPFADPPPLRYAYPCYALAEGRQVDVRIEQTAYAEVVVDQATSWLLGKTDTCRLKQAVCCEGF